MAFATVATISSSAEPVFWLVIFVGCSYFVARRAGGKYFLHGFLISLVNSVWITLVHVSFHDSYLANHPDQVAMGEKMHLGTSAASMLFMGPFIGAIFGLILGLFCFGASKIIPKASA